MSGKGSSQIPGCLTYWCSGQGTLLEQCGAMDSRLDHRAGPTGPSSSHTEKCPPTGRIVCANCFLHITCPPFFVLANKPHIPEFIRHTARRHHPSPTAELHLSLSRHHHRARPSAFSIIATSLGDISPASFRLGSLLATHSLDKEDFYLPPIPSTWRKSSRQGSSSRLPSPIVPVTLFWTLRSCHSSEGPRTRIPGTRS